MPIISTPASSAISGVTVTGTAASGQVPVASSGTAGAWKYPPGYEIGYDQITSPVSIASSTESSSTTVISCAAHTFDGGAVLLDVFFPVEGGSAATTVQFTLFESTTEIGNLGIFAWNTASTANYATFRAGFRFTPTAGSHTYIIGAFANNTTGTQARILAGAGGTATSTPAYARFTKV